MKECPNCKLCFDDDSGHCPHDGGLLFVSNKCGVTLDKRYTLERRLGKGGMGSVYRAKHVHLRSTHAIKIISPDVVRSDPTLLVRFTQEAILVASIHHPNVVSVTDFGIEVSDTLYLVMEYIEGISLDEFLRNEQRLSPNRAFEILKPVGLGVAAAHSQGITHRDLKPLNVMIRKGAPLAQAVKVLDFGLAKIKSTESFQSLVMAKTTNLLGSPHYMPPEQWDNENVDERSDIYSLGVMLFQMITGDVPFKGATMPNIMYQHLQAEVPTFESLGIATSRPVENVIKRALEKEQDKRYQTVESFLSAYEDALFDTNDRISLGTNAKTVSFKEESFPGLDPKPTQAWKKDTDSKTFNLSYLDSAQNETLATYFNQPKDTGSKADENLERRFYDAQNEVEAARTKVSQAERLAEEFNVAQKAAEDARLKYVEAQQKLEADIRRQIEAEMESKLAAERQAREKAEAEARQLAEEARARQEAEERANQLAKTALEAQHRAENERKKAEQEARQRQLEEGTRKEAEEAARRLAKEAADAKDQYEQARKKAEYEAHYRREAEAKRKGVEEEIERIAASELARRESADEEAARQIKEQASRLGKQAQEAQEKADEARLLAETEASKRAEAEAARVRAEDEARRLAEEIIAAQRRLNEAEERARTEAEKRAEEEAARHRAEESARSSSLENQQNLEEVRKDLLSQVAEAQMLAKSESEKRAIEEAARIRAEESARTALEEQKRILENERHRDSAPNINGETQPAIDIYGDGTTYADTGSTQRQHTEPISVHRPSRISFIAGGLAALLAFGGLGLFLAYYMIAPDAPSPSNVANEANQLQSTPQPPVLPTRIREKMVLLKGGSFLMGRDDADPNDNRIYASQFPAHIVPVDDLYLDRTEVTNAEYAEFVKAKHYDKPANWKGGELPAGQGDFPVTGVSYFDAQNFADWISARDQVPCRLPTEAEWEFAARSGSKQLMFPWGNDWDAGRVNFATGSAKPVGTSGDETETGKIEDMLGNVLEWTSSTFDYYPNFPDNLKQPAVGLITVRGVSYTKQGRDQLNKTSLLLTIRQGVSPEKKYEFLGFRLMCNSK